MSATTSIGTPLVRTYTPWLLIALAAIVVFAASGDLTIEQTGTRVVAVLLTAAVVSAIQGRTAQRAN
ncbi:hypothetical protein [Williamsia phyllosphaerae]|uniref:hypothetical protein n=1 Tax=Williamsia phyllosphaerae TaxID=885042 RepID=UPI001662ABF2|nr:hypothetical protein [Williamsia phyllosphaerae]